jgi:hypothetical protein
MRINSFAQFSFLKQWLWFYNLNQNKKNCIFILLSFFLAIITFPFVSGDFTFGLDSSYFWAHNYIFSKKIFFSESSLIYGPLAFLRHPLAIGNNMIYGLLFLNVIKMMLAFFLLRLNQYYENKHLLIVVVIVYFIFIISPAIDYLLLVLILVILFLHRKNKSEHLLLFAIFLSVEGFYIKNSIGISSSAMIFFYLIHELDYKKAGIKLIVLSFVFGVGLFFIQGILLFKNFDGIVTLLKNYYYTTIGFSEHMPFDTGINSSILFSVLIISFFMQVFLISDSIFRLYWFCTSFLFFSVFKHSMVRCDEGHYYSFIIIYLQLNFILPVLMSKINWWSIVLIIMPVIAYQINLKNKYDYKGLIIEPFNGLTNFNNYVLNYQSEKIEWEQLTEKSSSIPSLKLSEIFLNEIKNNTIDFYPWELSYVWKNKLNWKARENLQSLSMHNFFDQKTATYFSGPEAPQYLIWHLNKQLYGFNTDFTIIDERYLFTDQPLTTTAILKSYTPVKIENSNWLLKRQPRKMLISNQKFAYKSSHNLKYWVQVPQKYNYITTASIHINEKVIRKLKRFVFRDDFYWLELLTEKGSYFKHRISTSFITNKFWIGNYIKGFNETLTCEKIKSFKISSDNIGHNDLTMQLDWDFLEINPENSCDTCEDENIHKLFINN